MLGWHSQSDEGISDEGISPEHECLYCLGHTHWVLSRSQEPAFLGGLQSQDELVASDQHNAPFAQSIHTNDVM